jgi:GNAT superfamily N-acetyltransferase
MSIRIATSEDAEAIAELMMQLGYEASPAMIAGKLHFFAQSQYDEAFVATDDNRPVGCISVHAHELFHTSGKLGRITSLVVDEDARIAGVGAALIEAAERFFRAAGCIRAEVTSGDHRLAAHRFYLANGFVEDERRFIKIL